mmetsp:Transcript_66655/g.118290  ORF Transcript_66655/g.118290 Transcript_66655/m.118290 type:complete len:101 (-) Transcript_66655:519-821(-)
MKPNPVTPSKFTTVQQVQQAHASMDGDAALTLTTPVTLPVSHVTDHLPQTLPAPHWVSLDIPRTPGCVNNRSANGSATSENTFAIFGQKNDHTEHLHISA